MRPKYTRPSHAGDRVPVDAPAFLIEYRADAAAGPFARITEVDAWAAPIPADGPVAAYAGGRPLEVPGPGQLGGPTARAFVDGDGRPLLGGLDLTWAEVYARSRPYHVPAAGRDFAHLLAAG